jgi:branched-subunit amino acid aminotransferase/4-amino-4-deoxychorismate lyase
MGMTVEERPFTREELRTARELFLTGTGSEILGVVSLDDTPIADGKVGPTTQVLLVAFHERVAEGRDGMVDG